MALLETLLSAFKGGAQTRVPLSQNLYNGCTPLFENTTGRPAYHYERAVREGFIANPIAQRAVRIVAEGVGQAPIYSSDDRLMKLVTATSAGQSLIETLAAHLLLHGNAYVQILKDASGAPIELFALRPDRMSVITDSNGWPYAYDYRVDNASSRIHVQDEDCWPGIIQIKTMHPLDDYLGAGALSAAWPSITIHNAAAEWNRSLLENAARPSGALVYEGDDGSALTQDQFARLRSELDIAFSGPGNAGRPMLLDGGLKWQSMALSPADMDFATLKSAAAREIALAFGVPPMLLGLPGDNTYSNYREANRALWRLTLLPLGHKLLTALTEGLSPWFPDSELAIDLDLVPALSEDRERLWSQVSDADFLTRAEKRELLGFEPEENDQ
ncbi:MAG: phage portal protein [Erythrobacter sp.]